MADRPKKSALDLVAQIIAVPCIAAAIALYVFVTWAPDATWKRDLMCGALLLAGAGAGLINVGTASRRLRTTGATTMTVGLVAAVAIGLA